MAQTSQFEFLAAATLSALMTRSSRTVRPHAELVGEIDPGKRSVADHSELSSPVSRTRRKVRNKPTSAAAFVELFWPGGE
eukprot:155840-Rhodomonas_salina.1